MHFPLRRTVVSCCPVIILPGSAFLFICLCFAQPILDWGLDSVCLHMASKLYCSRLLVPRTAGCWAGYLDGSGRGWPFHYRVSRKDPWLGLAHRSNIRLYLVFVSLFVCFCFKEAVFPTNFYLFLTKLPISLTIELLTYTSHILKLFLFQHDPWHIFCIFRFTKASSLKPSWLEPISEVHVLRRTWTCLPTQKTLLSASLSEST